MTSPLVRLRDAVVAGEAKDYGDLSELCRDIPDAVIDYSRVHDLESAVLDPYPHGVGAAICLVRGWFPEWRPNMFPTVHDDWMVYFTERRGEGIVYHQSLSVAIVLACLAALIEKETT